MSYCLCRMGCDCYKDIIFCNNCQLEACHHCVIINGHLQYGMPGFRFNKCYDCNSIFCILCINQHLNNCQNICHAQTGLD